MAPRKAARPSMTLGEAWQTYWDGRQDVTDRYRAHVLSALEMHLVKLKARPVALITKRELLDELMVMDAKGLYEYVRKVRMWIGQPLDWAVEQEHCEVNVASLIRPEKAFGKAEVESHASLPLVEIGGFMKRLAMEGQLQSVLANHMLALTWVRTGELRMMVWSEIEGEDLWRIPKGKMKRRREHLVPLSTQAKALLKELKARSRSEYVFPSDRRKDRPMSENSILYLIHRCGFQDRMTGHGWRSVASTWANEAGYNKDAIERQLAHAPDDKVRAAYNNAEYLPERRAMLQAWADWLALQMVKGRVGAASGAA
jgi:integrase